MALTQDEIDITLMSLGRIGNKTNLTLANQITDVVGIKAELFFDQVRDSLLRSYSWNFAKTRLDFVSIWTTATTYATTQYVWAPYAAYAVATATVGGAGAGIFTITSTTDISAYFPVNGTFTISGSTGNDDDYTVLSSTYTSPTLTVVPVEAVANGTDDGSIVADYSSNLLYKCAVANTSDVFADDFDDGDWTIYSDRPTFEFSYQYILPTGVLRLLKSSLNDEDFDLEGTKILTDSTEVEIKYISQITDPDSWDCLFKEVFILKLALKLLTAIGGVKTPTLNAEITAELKDAMNRARTVNSNETNHSGESEWNYARFKENSVG